MTTLKLYDCYTFTLASISGGVILLELSLTTHLRANNPVELGARFLHEGFGGYSVLTFWDAVFVVSLFKHYDDLFGHLNQSFDRAGYMGLSSGPFYDALASLLYRCVFLDWCLP